MRLARRVAVVTGGSRGIGRAISVAFAQEGAKVAVIGRDEARCIEVVDQIASNGGTAISVLADVTRETDVAVMASKVQEAFSRIDILVNSAGVNMPFHRTVDVTLDQWNWIVNTNLTGPFLCCRAVVPIMMDQHSGKVINISSVGARSGGAGRNPYRVTKAGLINFSETLAAEVKEYGIDVNTICPAMVNTDMMRDLTAGNLPPTTMPPEDIASVAVFLASDESRAITGTAIDCWGPSNPLFGVQFNPPPLK